MASESSWTRLVWNERACMHACCMLYSWIAIDRSAHFQRRRSSFCHSETHKHVAISACLTFTRCYGYACLVSAAVKRHIASCMRMVLAAVHAYVCAELARMRRKQSTENNSSAPVHQAEHGGGFLLSCDAACRCRSSQEHDPRGSLHAAACSALARPGQALPCLANSGCASFRARPCAQLQLANGLGDIDRSQYRRAATPLSTSQTRRQCAVRIATCSTNSHTTGIGDVSPGRYVWQQLKVARVCT